MNQSRVSTNPSNNLTACTSVSVGGCGVNLGVCNVIYFFKLPTVIPQYIIGTFQLHVYYHHMTSVFYLHFLKSKTISPLHMEKSYLNANSYFFRNISISFIDCNRLQKQC